MMDPKYRILWLSTIGNTLETPAFGHPNFQRWIGMAETSKAAMIPWYDFASKSHTYIHRSLHLCTVHECASPGVSCPWASSRCLAFSTNEQE
ncbi:Sphingomyelin phosphodiesterase B [Fusarium oxysporum f. sp. albedinis]|nr:Sphingomyelin phosphodiesterase B [Fusarium oxysporum f. sp. albedinis]